MSPTWPELVLAQASASSASELLLGLQARDCANMAQVAEMILQGHRPRRRSEGWGLLWGLFGGHSPIESLAATVAASFDLPSTSGDVATARALQSVGMALCQQAGIPLRKCSCFQAPATWELEDTLLLVICLAMGDWSGLVLPFAPLPSP